MSNGKLDLVFTARQHMTSAVLAMINPVCPPVRHSPVSCQNDSSYDHIRSLEIALRNSKANIGSEGAE